MQRSHLESLLSIIKLTVKVHSRQLDLGMEGHCSRNLQGSNTLWATVKGDNSLVGSFLKCIGTTWSTRNINRVERHSPATSSRRTQSDKGRFHTDQREFDTLIQVASLTMFALNYIWRKQSVFLTFRCTPRWVVLNIMCVWFIIYRGGVLVIRPMGKLDLCLTVHHQCR